MTLTPTFTRLADMASRELLVKPLVYSYFFESKFPDEFGITFRKLKPSRKPDGWLHPSTHPMMPERLLYHYLAHPEAWEDKPFPFASRMAVLMGSATHDFIEMGLDDLGLLVKPEGRCACCGRRQPDQCHEHGVLDAELGSRGHLDGILKLRDGMVFEFKTAKSLDGLGDNDVAAFRAKYPTYYAQQQEYMRMRGLREALVLFMQMGTPWDMREILVPFDPAFSQQITDKYRYVRRCVERGTPPQPCCAPRSAQAKSCQASLCEVKAA